MLISSHQQQPQEMENGRGRGGEEGRGKNRAEVGRLVVRKGAWKKKLLEALKVCFYHPVPSHVRTRLVPQKPTKLLGV